MTGKYTLTITCDENDGDYVTQREVIDQETYDLLKVGFKAVREFEAIKYLAPYPSCYSKPEGEMRENWLSHNWGNGEVISDKEKELLKEYYLTKMIEDEYYALDAYIPYGQHGIHTVEEVTVTPYVEEEKWV